MSDALSPLGTTIAGVSGSSATTPRIGAILQDLKVIITSMSMEDIPCTQLGIRETRMRRDLHFGLEDPLYFPQLFLPAAGHLANIPYPSADPNHPHAIAWLLPKPWDFKIEDMQSPIEGIGRLSYGLRQAMADALEGMYGRVASFRVPAAEPDVHSREAVDLGKKFKADALIAQYMFVGKMLSARLSRLATFHESVLTFRMLQRVYLELAARISWLEGVEQMFVKPDPGAIPPVADVVGALCGDQDTADRLLHAGIPCWLVQPIHKKHVYPSSIWTSYSEPITSVNLRNTGLTLHLDDARPPYPTIYAGSSLAERYRQMGEFIRKCGSTNVYTEEVLPKPTLEASQPALGPSRHEKTNRRHRQLNSTVPRSPSTSKTHDRNKWVDVDSPIMPPSLPNWMKASKFAGERLPGPNPHETPYGYAVPDPNVIAGTANDELRSQYLAVWLKLRSLLIYRMMSPTFRPLKMKEWRSILTIESHNPREHTQSGKQRAAVKALLEECLVSGGMQGRVDLKHLITAEIKWQGGIYPSFMDIPAHSAQQMLWELFELNFRFELIELDRRCYGGWSTPSPSEVDKLERTWTVIQMLPHFGMTTVPDKLDDGRKGFASQDFRERRTALAGLYRVMEGWKGTSCLPRPLLEGGIREKVLDVKCQIWGVEFDRLEEALAVHYVSTFYQVLGRPPLLPHRLP